jgi:UDP-2,3-diacylglucosamine pyrophosphatase LpxH
MSAIRKVVVISDLHLGDNAYLEDFSADSAFLAFLHWYAKEPETHLILNGDTIDFLQTQPLGAYTLHSAPAKVRAVAGAHPLAMQALADFTQAGNQISVLEGNHDIEFLFDAPRKAFLHCLTAAGADASRIRFQRSTLVEAPHYHIEHGHQADRLNRFDYDNLLLDRHIESLNYPWGSYFVHRVFNHVEPEYRFIDKIRPESAAALLLRLVDPDRFHRFILPFLGLKLEDVIEDRLDKLRLAAVRVRPMADFLMKGASGEDDALAAFSADWAPVLDDLVLLENEKPRVSSGEFVSKGRVSDFMLEKLIVHLQNSSHQAIQRSAEYVAAAANRSYFSKAKVVVFGHTHHALRHNLPDGAHYLNSGTWTPLLRIPDREPGRDWVEQLKTRKNYPTISRPSFVEIAIEGQHTMARLMSWNPEGGYAVPEE